METSYPETYTDVPDRLYTTPAPCKFPYTPHVTRCYHISTSMEAGKSEPTGIRHRIFRESCWRSPDRHGQPLVPGMMWEGNRPSQRSMHYTQDEEQGVTFHYRGLDPHTDYRIRFTLVRPWYQDRYRARMNQKSETIYAGDFVLAKDVEIPESMSDFFTFDIPATRYATANWWSVSSAPRTSRRVRVWNARSGGTQGDGEPSSPKRG